MILCSKVSSELILWWSFIWISSCLFLWSSILQTIRNLSSFWESLGLALQQKEVFLISSVWIVWHIVVLTVENNSPKGKESGMRLFSSYSLLPPIHPLSLHSIFHFFSHVSCKEPNNFPLGNMFEENLYYTENVFSQTKNKP